MHVQLSIVQSHELHHVCVTGKSRNRTRLRNKPWITKGLLKSIRRKKKIRKTYYIINGSTNEQKFCQSFCKTLTRIKTLAKKLFYKTQFDVHKHDPKKTWDALRTLLPAKPKAPAPTTLSVNSRLMSLSDPILRGWPISRSRLTSRSRAIKWSIPSYQVIDRKNINCDVLECDV